MRHSAGIAAGVLVLLGGCGKVDSVKQPAPPPGYAIPAEYPLGDAAAAVEQRALKHAMQGVPASFGKPKVTWLLAPGPVDPATLKAYYDRATRPQWHALAGPGAGLAPGETAFGYQAGQRAFIVVVPAAQVGPRQVVTVAVYGPPA